MKKPVAFFLGLLLLILLVSVGGSLWYIFDRTYSDPADVIAVADRIWPLKIPDDMPPEFAINVFGAEGAHFGTTEPDTNMIFIARFPVAEETDAVVNWDFKIDAEWDADGLGEQASGTYQIPYQGEMLEAQFREGENDAGQVFRSVLLKRMDGETHEITVAWYGPADQVTEARFASLFQ